MFLSSCWHIGSPTDIRLRSHNSLSLWHIIHCVKESNYFSGYKDRVKLNYLKNQNSFKLLYISLVLLIHTKDIHRQAPSGEWSISRELPFPRKSSWSLGTHSNTSELKYAAILGYCSVPSDNFHHLLLHDFSHQFKQWVFFQVSSKILS